MSEKAFYHRRGWQVKQFAVASRNEEAGTVDLANVSGDVVVEGVPVINDFADRKVLPAGFAVIEGDETEESNIPLIVEGVKDGAFGADELADFTNAELLEACQELGIDGVNTRTNSAGLIGALLGFKDRD